MKKIVGLLCPDVGYAVSSVGTTCRAGWVGKCSDGISQGIFTERDITETYEIERCVEYDITNALCMNFSEGSGLHVVRYAECKSYGGYKCDMNQYAAIQAALGCVILYNALPVSGTCEYSTAVEDDSCSDNSDCSAWASAVGCLGTTCSSGECKCVYCGTNKITTPAGDGCLCNGTSNWCTLNYGYTCSDGVCTYTFTPKTALTYETCKNKDTICASRDLCAQGYYGYGSDCTACPSGGTTSGNGVDSLYNVINVSISKCYKTSGSDTTGDYEFTEECYYSE